MHIEQNAATLNPPIQNLAPRKARPHAMNRAVGANSGNFTAGAARYSLDFKNRAHGQIQRAWRLMASSFKTPM